MQAKGVLFDIDDTLVDLKGAMDRTLEHVSATALAHLGDDDWLEYKRLYSADPHGYYERYLAGELTFVEQRIHRARHAQERFGTEPFDDAAARDWNAAYELTLPLHFQPFPDVLPILDLLDGAGIPYGAVSNNVHDYQRAKLDKAGLERIRVLVGIDAVDAAKPDPAIFLEGARRLGSDPALTLYVGDNRLVDAVGADDAGLAGIWLNRHGDMVDGFTGREVRSLDELPGFLD